MKSESIEPYLNLDESLDELVKVYRHLLNVVRREREILVSGNLDELTQNNRTKEMTLLKLRELEEKRIKAAKDLALSEGLDPAVTRLLDFSRHFGGSEGERLRKLHSVLDLLIKRVREHNQYNEVLVTSALDTMTGAIGHLRDNLAPNKTYKKSGSVKQDAADSGQLVSREA